MDCRHFWLKIAMEKASPLAMAGAEMSQMLNVQLRDVGFVEVGGGWQREWSGSAALDQAPRAMACIAACHGLYWPLHLAEQRVSDVIWSTDVPVSGTLQSQWTHFCRPYRARSSGKSLEVPPAARNIPKNFWVLPWPTGHGCELHRWHSGGDVPAWQFGVGGSGSSSPFRYKGGEVPGDVPAWQIKSLSSTLQFDKWILDWFGRKTWSQGWLGQGSLDHRTQCVGQRYLDNDWRLWHDSSSSQEADYDGWSPFLRPRGAASHAFLCWSKARFWEQHCWDATKVQSYPKLPSMPCPQDQLHCMLHEPTSLSVRSELSLWVYHSCGDHYWQAGNAAGMDGSKAAARELVHWMALSLD